MRSFRPKPIDIGRQRARELVHRLAAEVRLARTSSGLTQLRLAELAGLSQQYVSAVERGAVVPSIGRASRIAAACGHELGIRLFPTAGPSLWDSGQLQLIELIVRRAAPTLHAQLEVPIAAGDPRAADLVLEGPDEVLHVEAERGLVDLQAQTRRAQAKRDVLSARYERPVRLVIAVSDTRRARRLARDHASLIGRTFGVSSRRVWGAIGSGTPVGGDGFLFVSGLVKGRE